MPVDNIAPNSITGIKGLDDRPVFFLKLNGQPQPTVVVKGDAGGKVGPDQAISIKWGSKMMKNVNNNQVNVKIMTSPEIVEFHRAAIATYPQGSPQLNFAHDGLRDYIWTKMPFVAGLSDADYIENYEVSGKVVKQTIQKLSDPQVWFDLGKVVAVDIFNGNSDRFDINTGTWINRGNIMFLSAGQQTKVIGLDMFDPFGGDRSNLNRGGGYEALKTLTEKARCRNFANSCVLGVGSKLKADLGGHRKYKDGLRPHIIVMLGNQPTPVALASMDTLFMPYAPDFMRGIEAGADQLKTYLMGKLQQYGPNRLLPRGVLLRMQYLGWPTEPPTRPTRGPVVAPPRPGHAPGFVSGGLFFENRGFK
jgi:hypothetical protein